MTLVALSGAYGAGGSRIGPALAERLGVPFVDRAIPAAVAQALAIPFDEAEERDEQISASWLERALSGFIDVGAPLAIAPATNVPADFRRATEAVLLDQAASGAGVILGRGAVIVLREHPGVLRARLDGPTEARVRQAMRLEAIDEATARRRLRETDRAHAAYAKHFYGADIRDPSLYHVVLDATALAAEDCVELLLRAAESLSRPGAA